MNTVCDILDRRQGLKKVPTLVYICRVETQKENLQTGAEFMKPVCLNNSLVAETKGWVGYELFFFLSGLSERGWGADYCKAVKSRCEDGRAGSDIIG